MTDDTRRLAHSADPETSHDAAERATNRAAVKGAILVLIDERGPLAAFELQEAYLAVRQERGWPIVQPHSIPRRLSELHVLDNKVTDSGVRRMSPFGRFAVVWERLR